ncbi:uncharacterized protein LOC128546202 isoform X2 [Mercenaria mercenaria]|uniref:uncharacterized protein LOC128546202 isoform X2 n=1 Tax=Mercenaria mercenaria TaxID=6596 RepID=UPI00234F10FA|nr:uncharacterized protein LOC128546202 isoform X2 [Mercenaria mercenaria]
METKKAREKKILITEDHPLGEMSIALDAPASMERVPEGYIDVNNELFISPKTFKKKDMMNPMNETSMNLNFKEKSWVGLTPRKSIVGMQSIMDPFSEMDSGVVLPISSLGSKTARSMRSPSKRKSIQYNSARTPRPMLNGDVREPLAITDGRMPYPVVGADDEAETKSFKREKSFSREAMTRSKSIYAPSVQAPSVRAPSVHAPSLKAMSVHAPSVKAPSVAAKSTKSVNSNKALSVRTNISRKPAVPKLTRSVSQTRLGSVTKRSPRKNMNRSKTTVMPLEANDPYEGGMTDFMNAEMSNWGDASQTARSRRSSRTTKTVAKSRTSTRGSPRKSIQSKMTGIPNYFKAISVK